MREPIHIVVHTEKEYEAKRKKIARSNAILFLCIAGFAIIVALVMYVGLNNISNAQKEAPLDLPFCKAYNCMSVLVSNQTTQVNSLFVDTAKIYYVNTNNSPETRLIGIRLALKETVELSSNTDIDNSIKGTCKSIFSYTKNSNELLIPLDCFLSKDKQSTAIITLHEGDVTKGSILTQEEFNSIRREIINLPISQIIK